MCGLAGFVGPGDAADLAAMTRVLAHRGPDGEGFYSDAAYPVHLGHRRLSIIDIAGGAQPMASPDGDVVVVYNGEIYNHRELRRELEARGYVFRSDHSDTEVLVHGWREWGSDLPAKINGMFAFAIWDRRAQSLFLARDRFGEKPLYWSRQGEGFYFASELTALSGHRGFRVEIDRNAVCKLLAYGFIPAPSTYWRDVAKLPGGGWVRYDIATQSVRTGRYWCFALEPQPVTSEVQAAETLRGLLEQAVGRRLMSDVPLGVFLSGGIDSGMVTAFAARQRGEEGVDAFSIGFEEPSFDESAHARLTAKSLGVRHHEQILRLQAAQTLVPELLSRLDEPQGDASLIPTYLLCGFARRSVTVALSGDGGDELFAGYDTFSALTMARIYHAVIGNGRVHRGLRRLADLLPYSPANMSFDYKLRRALRGLDHEPPLWHPAWLGPLAPEEIAELLHMPIACEELYAEALGIWAETPKASLAEQGLAFYTRLYLQDGILAKVDRAAMLHGLETRAVFLDNDLVDFVRRLPTDLKFRNGTRKYLLKRALEGVLPDTILHRAKKGFGVPLQAWLKHLPYPGPALSDGQGDVGMRRMHDLHLAGKADQRLALWCWQAMAHHCLAQG